MKKTQKMKMLDGKLGKQKLSKEEMKQINGGFACYCGSNYVGDFSDPCACLKACGVNC